MIPTFVISLPDCISRRQTVKAALDGLNLPFEFVDGVDGRNGLPPEREAEVDRAAALKKGNVMTDAEFACSLSHIDVYCRIVSEGLPYALMLADDHVPQPDLIRFLKERRYEDADITQLRHQRAWVRKRETKPLFGSYVSYLRATGFNVSGSCACVISREAAEHFVKNALPVTSPADWPDCIETLVARGRCRVISPPGLVLNQDSEPSLIHQAGRKREKDAKRVFGLYVPPLPRLAAAWKRAPRKPFLKRLRAERPNA